jgi:dipeptidyl aminopeptidase/acylaminoacyl peptidase
MNSFSEHPERAHGERPKRRPFDVDDLYLHRKPGKVHCVPGLDVAACVVRCVDREKNGYVSRIWSFALDGWGGMQITHGAGSSDDSPRWSDDGSRLAFISDRAGGSLQVYVMQREGGGEARQVGHFEQSVSSPRWHPDGKRLFVAAAVSVDPDRRGKRPNAPHGSRALDAPEVAWRLPYKEDGIGYLLQREIHLFSLDVDSGKRSQLTDGPFDLLAHEVSRDGRHVAYTRTREGRFAHASDLWICDAEGGGHQRCTFEHAIVMQPSWSPDGRLIAFTGALEDGDAEPRLWLYDRETHRTRPLGDVDVADPTSLHWSEDGRSLIFTRAHRGRHQVARIDVPDGRTLQVLVAGDRQIGAFAATRDRLVFSPENPSVPSELHVCRHDGRDERQISRLNPWWAERQPIDAEVREFDVPDGRGGTERIEGWLLRAEGAKGPMPLLSDIHGGPASYALMDFDTNVFWQVLCARGWAVLALNAVGSASYGHEFCRRLAGHWGELDLPQHLAAIEQLQADGICDERVAVSGKSYGGYLSAWATGHTDVFKAAVVMAPVGNIETHYGTSDGGYYADPFYIASKPRFDRERARQLSPLQHIEKSQTPTIFLQGKDDERCPKCQSEELFVSLARAGDTATELVLYPGETHGFLGSGKPACRADAARRIVDWISRFCGTGAVHGERQEEAALAPNEAG